MLYTPHFLVGAAIANLVPNPVIGLPLSLASHFVLDVIPHTDFDLQPGVTIREILSYSKTRRLLIFGIMTLDGLVMVAAFLWLLFSRTNPWYLLVGGLVGISPDAIEQFLMIVGKPLPGFQNQWQWRVRMRYGFISYPIVCVIALAFL